MAKGTARQQYRAGTLALGKTLKQARMGEFTASSDALGTLFGNLGTTQRGVARTLTSSNARKLAALQRLDKRTARQTNGAVSGAARSAANLFGGVAAAGQGYLFDQGAGHAKGAQTAQAGLGRAGGIISRGATEALGIQQAGAAEARAGADAQLAEALRYRAKNDAQLIAERQNLLLQSKLDFENWRKQQEYLKKQEDGDQTGTLAGLSVVARTGTQSFTGLQTIFNKPDEDGKYPDATSAATTYMQENGIDPASAEGQVIMSVASAMYQAGVNPEMTGTGDHMVAGGLNAQHLLAQAVSDRLTLLYPNYSKYGSQIQNVILTAASAQANSAAASAPVAEGEYAQSREDTGHASLKAAAGVLQARGALRAEDYILIANATGTDGGKLRFGDATEINKALDALRQQGVL